MQSYASNPTAWHLEDSIFRIYFSCRDRNQRSHIAFVDIDLNDPQRILQLAESPVLAPGETGLYDDSGVSMGSVVAVGESRFLFYVGWNLSVTVPWRNSIGLAKSDVPSENWQKPLRAPILDRHHLDPYSLSYPWVIHDEGRFKMWYGTNLAWGSSIQDMRHGLRSAESTDGVNWIRRAELCLAPQSSEVALSRPCVIRMGDGGYRMWFAARGAEYRIGYAESSDGLSWIRRDERAGIGVSSEGWDSSEVTYPCVFQHAGRLYMLYNGNSYGRTGFGLAVMENGS